MALLLRLIRSQHIVTVLVIIGADYHNKHTAYINLPGCVPVSERFRAGWARRTRAGVHPRLQAEAPISALTLFSHGLCGSRKREPALSKAAGFAGEGLGLGIVPRTCWDCTEDSGRRWSSRASGVSRTRYVITKSRHFYSFI